MIDTSIRFSKRNSTFLRFVCVIALSAIFSQVSTATRPPRSRIPDGRYPRRGIPLDAPFGGCTAIICISTVRSAARSAKGSQILLSNSGTRRRSGGAVAKWRIGKIRREFERWKRHADCERREVKQRFPSLMLLSVAQCAGTCKRNGNRNFSWNRNKAFAESEHHYQIIINLWFSCSTLIRFVEIQLKSRSYSIKVMKDTTQSSRK